MSQQAFLNVKTVKDCLRPIERENYEINFRMLDVGRDSEG